MGSKRSQQGRSLFTRVAIVAVVGLVVMHIVGHYYYGHERLVSSAQTAAASLAERVYELDQRVADQPDLLPLLQTAGFTMERVNSTELLGAKRWPHNDEIISAVQEHLSSLGMSEVGEVQFAYLAGHGPGRGRMQLLMPSVGGGYLRTTASTPMQFAGPRSAVVMTLLVFAVLGLILWLVRRQSQQLSRFVGATELLATGNLAPALPEDVGLKELRRASAAFNSMQLRVRALLDERSAMLAGISHDLRTLATRLGLRVENLVDEQQREKAAAEITLMTGILDQALTFTRDESSDEALASIDLVSLVETSISEFQDAGQNVTLQIRARPQLSAQPIATARMFMNLIDNAVKYGGQARVVVESEFVSIYDAGEGFDEEQAEAALKPFARLETARSQMLPGTGLGLSIAQNVCQRHGWQLAFAKESEGFCARVRFGLSPFS